MACSLPHPGFVVNSSYAVLKVRSRVMLDVEKGKALSETRAVFSAGRECVIIAVDI
jgi:hypothetical protein